MKSSFSMHTVYIQYICIYVCVWIYVVTSVMFTLATFYPEKELSRVLFLLKMNKKEKEGGRAVDWNILEYWKQSFKSRRRYRRETNQDWSTRMYHLMYQSFIDTLPEMNAEVSVFRLPCLLALLPGTYSIIRLDFYENTNSTPLHSTKYNSAMNLV